MNSIFELMTTHDSILAMGASSFASRLHSENEGIGMTREERPVQPPSDSRVWCDRHPCHDAANVRTNDPLAVGIEELRRPLHGFLPENKHRKKLKI